MKGYLQVEEKPSHKPPVPPPEMQAEPWDHPLVSRLTGRFPAVRALAYLGQPFIEIPAPDLYPLLEHLHQQEAFDFLVDLTAVDYPKRERRFELLYLLHSFETNFRLRVKTQLADGEPAESITDLYPGADWLEREVFDMFGIVFRGHPDLKRILLPDDWTGHPLRKDTSILAMDNDWVQRNLGIPHGGIESEA
jgi:NADH-quinone oxidoreductase subunit C